MKEKVKECKELKEALYALNEKPAESQSEEISKLKDNIVQETGVYIQHLEQKIDRLEAEKKQQAEEIKRLEEVIKLKKITEPVDLPDMRNQNQGNGYGLDMGLL